MGKTASEFFTGAGVFLDASSTLELVGKAGMEQGMQGTGYQLLSRMYIPDIVMKAFAAELYLKALIVSKGKQIKKIHKLDELLELLGDPEKKTISTDLIFAMRHAKGLKEIQYGESELIADFNHRLRKY